MYRISKEFHFSASHSLEGLPETHPCSNLHGHNYVVIVELKSKRLNNIGFVVDYRELDSIKRYIDTKLDHKHLNSVLHFNPTAENIAKYLHDEFIQIIPQISTVTVKETEKTMAKYSAS